MVALDQANGGSIGGFGNQARRESMAAQRFGDLRIEERAGDALLPVIRIDADPFSPCLASILYAEVGDTYRLPIQRGHE